MVEVGHGVQGHDDNFRQGVLVLFEEGGHLLAGDTGVANVAESLGVCLARRQKSERGKGLVDARRRHLEGRKVLKGGGVESPQFQNVHKGLPAAIYIVDCFEIHSY